MRLVNQSDNTKVLAVDAQDESGACHHYAIGKTTDPPEMLTEIHFQKGPVKENGINGIQCEDLLHIVCDRIQGFQAGPYGCRENAIALTFIQTGLLWLENRTAERKARGVEGTNQQ